MKVHRMKTLARPLALAAALLAGAGAFAQTAPQRTGDDSLYQALGGQGGLTTLMDRFMERLLADARMRPFFKDADQQHVKSSSSFSCARCPAAPAAATAPT